jgi:predicted  nucleic acid-binding Zn-ribbon protein
LIQGGKRLSILQQLWEYQKAEIELEEFESKLKSTATRHRLMKLQRYLQEQQNVLVAMENDMLVKQNEVSEVSSLCDNLVRQLEDKKKILTMINEKGPQDLTVNDIKDLVKDYETLYDNINRQKKSLQTIQSQVEKSDNDFKTIVNKVNKAKKEFADLKEEYAKELEAGSPELDRLKKALEESSKVINAKLMERYKKIKKNKKDPVALVLDGRCSGCNMQLPSGDLISYAHSDKIFECENCGRILYIR